MSMVMGRERGADEAVKPRVRVAIYCRISKDTKVDGEYQMLGVDRQEEDCRSLCEALGWEIVEVYVDNDISASTGKRRPSYEAMLSAITAGEVDAIACWHPDRLYRRTMDLERLVEVADKRRVPIATVNAGEIDLTTPSGRLVARLLGAAARYEGEHKSERWRRAYQQRREAGLPPPSGPRCFGWTRDGTVIPEEATAIRLAATYILGGGSLMQACRDLTGAGVRTTRGNAWTPRPLTKLLTNPRLAGWVTYKGERVCKSDWEPILDEATFEALTAMLTSRRHGIPRPRVAILLGLAYCGTCGGEMYTSIRYTSQGGRRIYRCPKPEGMVDGKECASITAEPLEQLVEAFAQRRLEDPAVRAMLDKSRGDGMGSRSAKELATLEARLTALKEALVGGDDDVPEVVAAIATVRARITELTEELATVRPVYVNGGTWPSDVSRRRAFIGLAVERVVIDPSTPGARSFDPGRVHVTPRT